MNKAVRKVSAGTKETPGKKREGRINDSLLGEKNGLPEQTSWRTTKDKEYPGFS